MNSDDCTINWLTNEQSNVESTEQCDIMTENGTGTHTHRWVSIVGNTLFYNQKDNGETLSMEGCNIIAVKQVNTKCFYHLSNSFSLCAFFLYYVSVYSFNFFIILYHSLFFHSFIPLFLSTLFYSTLCLL
mgnify:CR=1 FL=1